MAEISQCSLQITPACNLPLKALRGGGQVVIVNLQVCFPPFFPSHLLHVNEVVDPIYLTMHSIISRITYLILFQM